MEVQNVRSKGQYLGERFITYLTNILSKFNDGYLTINNRKKKSKIKNFNFKLFDSIIVLLITFYDNNSVAYVYVQHIVTCYTI